MEKTNIGADERLKEHAIKDKKFPGVALEVFFSYKTTGIVSCKPGEWQTQVCDGNKKNPL